MFIQVSLEKQIKDALARFEQAISERPEVMECYLMTGDADYLLRVVVPDVPAYERFLKEWLTRIEGVARIKSSFGLQQVKYSTALPLKRRQAPESKKKRSPREFLVRSTFVLADGKSIGATRQLSHRSRKFIGFSSG